MDYSLALFKNLTSFQSGHKPFSPPNKQQFRVFTLYIMTIACYNILTHASDILQLRPADTSLTILHQGLYHLLF